MSTIDAIQKRWGDAATIVGPGVSALLYKAFVSVEEFAGRLANAAEKRRSRKVLMMLSDHQLDDIGITRAQAQREAGRPLWY